MPWCPNCRLEYVEGIKICPDCKTALVDSLKDAEEISHLEDELNDVSEYEAEYSESGNECSSCNKELNDQAAEEAIRQITVLLRQKGVPEEEIAGLIENAKRRAMNTVPKYESFEDKYKDNASSGITLLTIGLLGIIAAVLCFCDVIKLPMQGSSFYLTTGVMSVLFLIFVFSGFKSMLASKKLSVKAEEEKEKIDEIVTFLKEANKTGKFKLNTNELSMEEESLYISNMAVTEVERNFKDLTPGFSYYVVDRFYSDIFESDED